MVMELCSGKDLLKHITDNEYLSEESAAGLVQ
jgi:hypothetical protein